MTMRNCGRWMGMLLGALLAVDGLAAPTAQAAPAGDQGAKAVRSKKRPAAKGRTQVVFETTKGKFTVTLNEDKAPISASNMLGYVESKFYDGTVFHRVISDFMIQGGGFGKDLTKKITKDPIKNEADNGLSNTRGTVAMARTNVVDSATSQFFINVKDNYQLDHSPANFGYAVVGEVTQGMDVVDAIRSVPVKCPSQRGDASCNEGLPMGMRDVPVEPVVILRAYQKKGAGR